jgi:N-acyl-D-aspartate/D-glutamate deacylase
LAFLWLMAVPLAVRPASEPFDVLIANGTVVDGSGAPRYRADVGVRDGRIAAIGDLSKATAGKRIDATGLIVAPGFIDVHTHSDRGLIDPDLKDNKGFVTQGVTASVFGADGGYSPRSINELKETFRKQGVGTHYAFMVGVNAVRREVMGMENRPPTPEEMQEMKSLVRAAMESGAVGLSSALLYLPGRFASTEEVIELAKIAAEYDGLYDSHVRSAIADFEGSHKECIEIGERSGARPHPAHYKAVGKQNWGKAKALNDYYQARIDAGVDITVDQYPYDSAMTSQLIEIFVTPPEVAVPDLGRQLGDPSLSVEAKRELIAERTRKLIEALHDPKRREAIRVATEQPPPGVFSAVGSVGGYDALRILVSEKQPQLEGRLLVDIAAERKISPFELMADLVTEEGERIKVTPAAATEDDVREIMQRPWTMIASDGNLTGLEDGRGHPRSRGTFPRVLGRYVREWKVLTLEDAIRKMTSLPAGYYRLGQRGLIREGYWADLTVFDPETVIDRSTWRAPERYSEGIIHVLMEGEPVLENGRMTGAFRGRFLPRADRAVAMQ